MKTKPTTPPTTHPNDDPDELCNPSLTDEEALDHIHRALLADYWNADTLTEIAVAVRATARAC